MPVNPDDDEPLPARLSTLVRTFPADLSAVLALVLVTDLVVLAPVLRTSPLRIGLGLVFALFVPGYALVAALFPEADARSDEREDGDRASTEQAGIDALERLVLSFGSSVAVVVLVSLALNFTPWGIRLIPIVVALTAFVLVAVAVATRRRLALPADERFRVHVRESASRLAAELRDPPTRTDLALNVLLVASFLLAAASVGFAVTATPAGDPFTETYLLTENESGELVADDYPTNFTAGESRPLVVGVGNHEGEPANYTVVVELHRIDNDTDGPAVGEERELRRFETPRLADGETWNHSHTIEPRLTGDRLRLTYLLYRGSPPDDPTLGNAYRETHLWISVSERADDRRARIPRP